MNDQDYLELVKANLGISSNARDAYLLKIIDGVIGELENSNICPNGQDESYRKAYEIYVIDYSAWMYRNRGGEESLPRHLEFRKHNLQIGHIDVE